MADTLEIIQAIPTELREWFKKDYIKIKLWQRKMLGWEPVHAQFNEKINEKLAGLNLNDLEASPVKRFLASRRKETLDLIKELPTELREWFLKEYIKIKLQERTELGWYEVHKSIKAALYCKRKQRISNIIGPKYKGMYICNICERIGNSHFIDCPDLPTH